jgi:hypothetical protein
MIVETFKILFETYGYSDDLINLYLVFMGVRPACLISKVEYYHIIDQRTNLTNNLEIHYGRYPQPVDYPLVCLRNSWVSLDVNKYNGKFSDKQLGLYLGFVCFDDPNWNNPRVKRYTLIYHLRDIDFYVQVCSKFPTDSTIERLKFKCFEMQSAMKLIDVNNTVIFNIEDAFYAG